MSKQGKALCVLLVIAGALIGTIVYLNERGKGDFWCDDTATIVSEGDSLWSIAGEHCYGDTAAVVDSIYPVYGDLTVGEVVFLPQNEDCRVYAVELSALNTYSRQKHIAEQC